MKDDPLHKITAGPMERSIGPFLQRGEAVRSIVMVPQDMRHESYFAFGRQSIFYKSILDS